MPSTSYAIVHSDSERHRPTLSPKNTSLGSRSANATSVQGKLSNRPKDIDATGLRMQNGGDRYPPDDKRYRCSDYERNTQDRGKEKKHNEVIENRSHKRHSRENISPGSYSSQKNSNLLGREVSGLSNETSRNKYIHSSSSSKNGRSKSYDKEHLPGNSRTSDTKRRSSEREALTKYESTTIDSRRSVNEAERRYPLMSQREAFRKQQEGHLITSDVQKKEKRGYNYDNYASGIKDEEKHPKGKISNSMQIKARRNSTDNKGSDTPQGSSGRPIRNHRVDYKEHMPLKNEKNEHYATRSRSPRKSTREKYIQKHTDPISVKNEFRPPYKTVAMNGENTTEYKSYNIEHYSRETRTEKNNGYNERNTNAELNKDLIDCDMIQNNHYEDDTKGNKRKLNHAHGEHSSSRKKGKYHPGVQPKGRKSNQSENARNDIKPSALNDFNSSRDSDIDSVSSETKRISALARLGPKVTMDQRLSKSSSLKEESENILGNGSEVLRCKNPEVKDVMCPPSTENVSIQSQDQR